MASIVDFSFLDQILNITKIFGENSLIPIILIFLLILIITRQPSYFGILFLPVLLWFKAMGVYISSPVYIALVSISSIIFVTTSLSINLIKSALSSINEKVMSDKTTINLGSKSTFNNWWEKIKPGYDKDKLTGFEGGKVDISGLKEDES